MDIPKRKQKSIFQFFCKKSNAPIDYKNNSSDATDTSNDVTVSVNTETVNSLVQVQRDLSPCNNSSNKIIVKDSPLELNNFTNETNDIGNFLHNVDDHTKFRLLNSSLKPEPSFKFPFSIHTKNGVERKRFLRLNHFDNYSWLAYSEKYSGLFCKICVLCLVHKNGGKQKNKLQKLVTKPLQEFAKLLGKDGYLETHCKTTYHKEAALSSIDFLKSYIEPNKQIINLINTERIRQVKENRERLKPIIQSIIFLGHQNIAFRGHRKHNSLLPNTSNFSCINEGNFRELLKFRIASGDHILENHLSTTHSKATYISHSIQEDIIQCYRNEIIFHILEDVKKNKYFSIIFDETTDISNISQMSLTLRYIDCNYKVHEKFISFLDCHEYVYGQG